MSERTDEREVSDTDLDDLLEESVSTGEDVDLAELEDDVVAGSGSGADAGLDGDLGVDVDALTSEPGAGPAGRADGTATSTETGSAGLGARIAARLRGVVRNPLPGVPSPGSVVPSARSFAVSLGVTVVCMLVVGTLVPLPASGLLGVFAGAFTLGVVSARRRYLELVVSGALAAGLSLVFGSLTLAALGGLFVPLAAFGVGGGAAAGFLGHYFGRDLRDGLTRSV